MSRLTPSELIFCYDGSFEGFLSAVFHAYATHRYPASFADESSLQLSLYHEVETIPMDLRHAERVREGLIAHGGMQSYSSIETAFLSDEAGRESALFAYIVSSFDGSLRRTNIADPVVAQVERLVQSVLHERELMYQFLRFEEMENGVYLAKINPKARVVSLLMEHFTARFNTQPFIIYDEIHHMAGVQECGRWSLLVTDEIDIPPYSADERVFQDLWKTFYDAVSHEKRYNPDLRRGFMPKRLWRNMTEFKVNLSSLGQRSDSNPVIAAAVNHGLAEKHPLVFDSSRMPS